MALKTYIGVNGTARRVKNAYFGKDGKAHRVRKAYIGIGGKARPCWTGHLDYWGELSGVTLSAAKKDLTAATIGNYALFAGGVVGSQIVKTVDAVSSGLSKTTPSSLNYGRCYLASTSTESHAFFGGGHSGGVCGYVETYSTGLTRSTRSELSTYRMDLAATSVEYLNNTFALFAGGSKSTTTTDPVNNIDLYYDSGTKYTGSTYGLSIARSELAATSVGRYAFFGGGRISATKSSNALEVFDSSTSTIITPAAQLAFPRHALAATTIGEYALFGGGININESGPTTSNCVDIFNTELTRVGGTSLSVARSYLAATSVGGYAIFAGGTPNGEDPESQLQTKATVDAFDTSFTRISDYIKLSNLTTSRSSHAATTVGSYALFGGGHNDKDGLSINSIEAYMAP